MIRATWPAPELRDGLDFAADVMMDAYAISGVRKEQIRYLSAPDHLSPTHVYGVTFERGVSVAYQDRKHIIISGTASIDSAGKIVYRDERAAAARSCS